MVNGTFTADGTGAWVRLQYGTGYLLLRSTTGNGFGSGTLTLQIRADDGSATAITVTSYTAVPSPNPDGLDFGATVFIRVVLASATAPTLYWEIGEGRVA